MSAVLLKTIKKRIDFIKVSKKGKKKFTEIKWEGNNVLLFGSEGFGLHQSKEKKNLLKVLFFKNIKGIFYLKKKKIQLELD